MARTAGQHVYGPYKRVNKRGDATYRIVIKSGAIQVAQSFRTEDEALKAAARERAALQVRTVDEAVSAYLDYLRDDRHRPTITITTLRNSITRIVRPSLDRPLLSLTPAKAKECYGLIARSGEFRPDTHQNSLRDARSAWKWMGKEGWVPRNPWDGIEPIGERTKGKTQLRRDEARKLLAYCVDRLDESGVVASLLCLLLAMRISEVVALRGRDIDDGGRLLWIDKGKTRHAKRELEVPGPLQAVLRARAKEAGSAGRLFPFTRNWVSYWCRVLCEQAEVTVVAGHALRGTHATLATQAGATSHLVAAALGHGSTRVTEAHYTQPDAIAGQTQKRAMKALAGATKKRKVSAVTGTRPGVTGRRKKPKR